MWVQKTKNGYRFFERYPLPNREYKVLSVSMPKNNAQTRKAAQKLLDEKSSEFTGSGYSLSGAIKAFLADKSGSVKPQSMLRYKAQFDTLEKLLGGSIKIADITAGYVRKILLSQEGKSAEWKNDLAARLKDMLRWAYRNDLLPSLACVEKLAKFEDQRKEADRIEAKFLTKDELAAVLDAMKDDTSLYLITKVLALSGMRFGELAALEAADVGDSELLVNKTYNSTIKQTSTAKTGSSSRRIHLQPELAATVREVSTFVKTAKLKNPAIRDSTLFFPNPKAKAGDPHLQNVAYDLRLKKICEKTCGKSLTAHGLRHTHASLLFEAGLSYDQVARRLGHENSAITKQIYVHITERLREKDAEALDAISLFI